MQDLMKSFNSKEDKKKVKPFNLAKGEKVNLNKTFAPTKSKINR
jgi:hypothetical protein